MLNDLKAWMDQGLMSPILKPSFLVYLGSSQAHLGVTGSLRIVEGLRGLDTTQADVGYNPNWF